MDSVEMWAKTVERVFRYTKWLTESVENRESLRQWEAAGRIFGVDYNGTKYYVPVRRSRNPTADYPGSIAATVFTRPVDRRSVVPLSKLLDFG